MDFCVKNCLRQKREKLKENGREKSSRPKKKSHRKQQLSNWCKMLKCCQSLQRKTTIWVYSLVLSENFTLSRVTVWVIIWECWWVWKTRFSSSFLSSNFEFCENSPSFELTLLIIFFKVTNFQHLKKFHDQKKKLKLFKNFPLKNFSKFLW